MGIPVLLLILLFVIGLLAVAAVGLFGGLRGGRRVTEPVCAKCGYGVRGLPSFTCPECGADLREAGIHAPGSRGSQLPIDRRFLWVPLWTLALPIPALLLTVVAASTILISPSLLCRHALPAAPAAKAGLDLAVPGIDVSGTVAAVGARVTRFSPGDEVYGMSRGSFAGYAAVALANAHLYDTQATLAQQMQAAMQSRAIIEQAKGILMDTQGLSETEAFRKIQKMSMNNRKSMRAVAASSSVSVGALVSAIAAHLGIATHVDQEVHELERDVAPVRRDDRDLGRADGRRGRERRVGALRDNQPVARRELRIRPPSAGTASVR